MCGVYVLYVLCVVCCVCDLCVPAFECFVQVCMFAGLKECIFVNHLNLYFVKLTTKLDQHTCI